MNVFTGTCTQTFADGHFCGHGSLFAEATTRCPGPKDTDVTSESWLHTAAVLPSSSFRAGRRGNDDPESPTPLIKEYSLNHNMKPYRII